MATSTASSASFAASAGSTNGTPKNSPRSHSSSDFPQPVNIDAASNVPPVCTKTWFHTGAFFGEAAISKHLEHEYYSEGDASDAIAGLTRRNSSSMLLDDTVLPTTILLPDGTRIAYDLSGEEMREACRALRGSILRQEVYALDGTDASDRPYSVSERNYTIEVFQPQGPNRYGVFFAHPRETIDFHYERKLFKVVGNTLADPKRRHRRQERGRSESHACVHAGGRSLRKRAAIRGRRLRTPLPGSGAHARRTKPSKALR